MIVARAPMRITLGGSGTDRPSYYTRFGGCVLTAAIDRYVRVAVQQQQAGSSWATDALGDEFVTAALRHLELDGRVRVQVESDAPAGSGLGGSGALGVATLLALHTLRHESPTPADLAEEAYRIEREHLGRSTGKQDPFIAAFGGILRLEIDAAGGVEVSAVSISHATEASQWLFHTGITRDSAEVLVEQDTATANGDARVIEYLHTIKALGDAMQAALEKGDLARAGSLLDAHWLVKRELSGGVSSARMGALIECARVHGATGAKIVGAGGAGSLLAYCPGDKAPLQAALARQGLTEIPFRFGACGAHIIRDAPE